MTEAVANRPVRHTCAVASALVFLASACSAPEPANTTTPSPTSAANASTAVSASPADAAKQLAITAYLGMWRNYVDAATTSDWQSPKLAEFASGTALSTMSRGLYNDHYNGLVSRGRPVNNPTVASAEPSASPTRIVISDCGDSTNWKKYRADNDQPVTGDPGGRRLINAVVDRQADSSWKVSDFGVREVGSC